MKNEEGRGIFITGTDTGVGKTFLGAGIAGFLRSRGIDVGAMKPAETGCRTRGSELVPHDARTLLRASGTGDPIDMVNPCRFRAPLAPLVAAEREGTRVDVRRIMSAYRKIMMRHDFVIVEGAGGIMVPLTRRMSYLDLAAEMGLPVLIVARPGLGAINHTVLTVMALRSRQIPVSAVVVNHRSRARKGIAERTNPSVIERLTGVGVISLVCGGGNISDVVAALRITP
jgi:dethiobiotin synthetase